MDKAKDKIEGEGSYTATADYNKRTAEFLKKDKVDGAAREAHAVTDVDVTLGGVVELSGLRWDALHRTGEDPQVVGTFDIGSARARLRGSEAATRESIAAFEQVVLRALEETENSLVAYREDQQRLVKLVEQARESSRAASIARVRYREGAADFLALLDAERTELQAADSVADAESGVFTSVIAVYKALGGIPDSSNTGVQP